MSPRKEYSLREDSLQACQNLLKGPEEGAKVTQDSDLPRGEEECGDEVKERLMEGETEGGEGERMEMVPSQHQQSRKKRKGEGKAPQDGCRITRKNLTQ